MSDPPTLAAMVQNADVEPTSGLPRLILAALEQTRAAACITTAELDPPGPRIVYVNPAYAAMTGRRREDVIGKTPRIMQGPLTDRAVLDRLRDDLAHGRRFDGETVNYRADGTPFIINWSIDPVRDEDGTITHFVATQEDVTDRVRLRNLVAAEKRLDDALTAELGPTRDAQTAFDLLAARIAAGVATIAGVGTPVVTIRDDRTAITATIGDGSGPGTTVDLEFARPEAMVRGSIGVAGLGSDELAVLDRAGLERFTARAGAVVEALAEYHRQRRVALQLQLDLLPPADVTVAGFDVVTRYLPGSAGLRVGGDWYDVVESGDRLVVSVGDVAGSGVDAAALMGRLRLLARAEVERGGDGEAALRVLDATCAADGRMATAVIVECDRRTGSTTTWSAGHLPPVLATRDAGTRLVPLRTAPPLGHLEGLTIDAVTGHLDVGDTLLLYSDGLVERRDESLDVGLERLVGLVDGGSDIEATVATLLSVSGPELHDDVALVAIRRTDDGGETPTTGGERPRGR